MPDAPSTTEPTTTATPAPIPTPPTPAPAAAAPAPSTTPDEPLGAPGLAALAQEREARKAAEKTAAAAQQKIQEYEDRDKSEAQKREEENARLKAENAQLALDNLRRDVASEKGLNSAQAKRLVGTTRDEMEADADDILKNFPTAAAPTPITTDVGQGHRDGGNARVYRMSELNDHAFYLKNKDDILLAQREGRIVSD